jgi:hypothetical protein
MDNTDALRTHSFSDGIPNRIAQDGKNILHQRCLDCGRDFGQELDVGGWRAIYLGVLRVELLADSVNDRWLREPRPKKLLASDNDDRAMRHDVLENPRAE